MKHSKTSSHIYYIYLDTKIQGAVEQLLSYFRSGVFNAESCIAVYVKYYKENDEFISKVFEKNNVPYKFIKKHSDITFEDGKVVFYLFNAQSNCRMVAFRNVSHVFITHGESNKKSSVKPIVRIYDHVVTSGQVGIDRYLKAGIFTECDVENNRVIRLGNTFVGQNNYHYDKHSRTLLYAPTWEGGVLDENFSSITESTHEILLSVIREQGIKRVVIQIHPNLGHRDPRYRIYFEGFLKNLTKHNVNVMILKNDLTLKNRFEAFRKGFKYISSDKKVSISYAITDISAMEIQLLVRNVPTVVLANKQRYKELVIPNKMRTYYLDNLVYLDDYTKQSIGFSNPETIISYIESYEEKFLKNLGLSERVEWLCEYADKNRVLRAKIRESI